MEVKVRKQWELVIAVDNDELRGRLARIAEGGGLRMPKRPLAPRSVLTRSLSRPT